MTAAVTAGRTDIKLPVLAFAVAVAYWPGIFSAASAPRWWVLAIGLPLASRLDPRNLDRSIALCAATGLIWSAVSLALLPVPLSGVLDLYLITLICGTAVAAAGVDDLDQTLSAFGWGVAVSSALAVPQVLGWSPIPTSGTAAGLFFNPEVLAETAAPILVWALWTRRWSLAGGMALPLAVCHSRAAVLVVAVGLLYGWRPRRRFLKAALITAVVVAGATAVLFLGINKASSGMTRVVLWMTAIDSLTPLGHGLGWWPLVHPGAHEEYVHSDALQMAVELGVGSLLFLVIPILILRRRDAGSIGERAAFVSICLEAAISFPLHLPATGFVFAVLAGFLGRARVAVRVPEPRSRAGVISALRRAISPRRRMEGSRG